MSPANRREGDSLPSRGRGLCGGVAAPATHGAEPPKGAPKPRRLRAAALGPRVFTRRRGERATPARSQAIPTLQDGARRRPGPFAPPGPAFLGFFFFFLIIGGWGDGDVLNRQEVRPKFRARLVAGALVTAPASGPSPLATGTLWQPRPSALPGLQHQQVAGGTVPGPLCRCRCPLPRPGLAPAVMPVASCGSGSCTSGQVAFQLPERLLRAGLSW